MESSHDQENNHPSSNIDEASLTLHAMVARLGTYDAGLLRDLIADVPEPSQAKIVHAIADLRNHLFAIPKDGQTPSSEPDAPYGHTADRLLSIAPNIHGGAVSNFKRNMPMNSSNFETADLPTYAAQLPSLDIFNDMMYQDLDTITVYPALAAYTLKAIVGQTNAAKRKLVDSLDNRQLVELISYACLIRKAVRNRGARHGDSDIQSTRVLLSMTGKSDQELASLSDGNTNDASFVRRSRRSWMSNVQQHSGLILFQISEMLADPDYSLVYQDELRDTRIKPELVNAVEAIIQPSTQLTPREMIKYAMRRYIATALAAGELDINTLNQNAKVIWLKINGISDIETTKQTGYEPDEQSRILASLHTSKSHELPLSKPFWRQVASILEGSTEYSPFVNSHASPLLELSSTELMPSLTEPSATNTGNNVLSDLDAMEMVDLEFKKRVDKIILNNAIPDFISWASRVDTGWVNHMQCRDNPESLLVSRNPALLPKKLLERCITCPVREICLGNALAIPPPTNKDSHYSAEYYYAGYSPDERIRLIQSGTPPEQSGSASSD